MIYSWHIGEWKKSGIVLYVRRLPQNWNLTVRQTGDVVKSFLEDNEVTEGLKELNFDFYIE